MDTVSTPTHAEVREAIALDLWAAKKAYKNHCIQMLRAAATDGETRIEHLVQIRKYENELAAWDAKHAEVQS